MIKIYFAIANYKNCKEGYNEDQIADMGRLLLSKLRTVFVDSITHNFGYGTSMNWTLK